MFQVRIILGLASFHRTLIKYLSRNYERKQLAIQVDHRNREKLQADEGKGLVVYRLLDMPNFNKFFQYEIDGGGVYIGEILIQHG